MKKVVQFPAPKDESNSPAAKARAIKYLNDLNKKVDDFINSSLTPFELKRNVIARDEEGWKELKDNFDRTFAKYVYDEIINNIRLGEIFMNVKPKIAVKPGDPERPLNRAEVCKEFGLTIHAGEECIKLAKGKRLVMATINRALKTGDPISQKRIIELLRVDKILNKDDKYHIPYLQWYEEIFSAASERMQAEKLEAERLEAEKLEAGKLEAEKLEGAGEATSAIPE